MDEIFDSIWPNLLPLLPLQSEPGSADPLVPGLVMTIYIPFLRAESAQLAGQARHYRETITFTNDRALAAVKGALRVVAHGSKDGTSFTTAPWRGITG